MNSRKPTSEQSPLNLAHQLESTYPWRKLAIVSDMPLTDCSLMLGPLELVTARITALSFLHSPTHH